MNIRNTIASVLFALFIVGICLGSNKGRDERALTISCNAYLDSSVLVRSTGFGEEQIINGNYQAVAQQYNGLSGQLKSVLFKGRVNPVSGNAFNTVRVVVYNANLGLPGTIIGSQNVTLDSASVSMEVIATFATPLNVNGDVIISIEPFSPVADNFFIDRNNSPDGMFLNLIKIKQGNQWFKNLAAGDPAFDFDFYIIPVTSNSVTAGFTSNTATNITSFNNLSTNATSYLWDFGDGGSSTLFSPTHNYSTSGNYNVTLKAFRQGINMCVDSITVSINVVITGLEQLQGEMNGISIENNLVTESLIIYSGQNMEVKIIDANGKEMQRLKIVKGRKQIVDTVLFPAGMYYVVNSQLHKTGFIKLNY